MVGKPIVDIMETHIGFGHIRPLEGSTGVFVCILWRISRFLTTRSLCSLTCPHFVQLSTELFFASYSTGFKLHFESVYRIFPTKIKKPAQEQPSRSLDSCISILKYGPIWRSRDLWISILKKWTNSAVLVMHAYHMHRPIIKIVDGKTAGKKYFYFLFGRIKNLILIGRFIFFFWKTAK